MAIELATAYVSIVPETKNLKRQLEQAFRGADPVITPTVNTRSLHDSMRGTGSRVGATFASTFGSSASAGIGSAVPGIGRAASQALSASFRTESRVFHAVGSMIGTTIKGALLGVLGAAGLSVGAVFFKGFERLESLDRSRKQLEALNRTLVSSGKAGVDVQAVMADVQKTVEGTPIALNDAFALVPQLLAAGIQPGKDLNDTMLAIADAVGFVGDPAAWDSISQGMNQVINHGKLMQEDLMNQFSGIPLRQWLMDSMKLDGATIDKMISDGKIGYTQVISAIEQHAGGMAKAAGDTIAGAMANAMTALARVGFNFISALFGDNQIEAADNIVEGIKRITDKLNDVSNWVTAHKDQIRDWFLKIVDVVKDIATKLGDMLGWLSRHPDAIKAVATAFVAWETIKGIAAVVTALQTIKTLLVGMPAAASTAGAGIATGLAPALGPISVIAAALGGLWWLGNQDWGRLTNMPPGVNPTDFQRGLGNMNPPGQAPGIPGGLADVMGAPPPPPGVNYKDWYPAPGQPAQPAPNEPRNPGLPPILGAGGVAGGRPAPGTGYVPSSISGISRAAELSGQPYSWGNLDCSGYLSQVYSAMVGQTVHFTTEADFAALGFHPGYMPGALNIGVVHGGPGGGHMAGTLPNGINVESGGSSGGVRYGSTVGANDPQFTEQWWFMPGGIGGSFDQGGWLGLGAQLVLNKTGKPELVLNQDQAGKLGAVLGMSGINPADIAPHMSGIAGGLAAATKGGDGAALKDLAQQGFAASQGKSSAQLPDTAANRQQGYVPASAANLSISGKSVVSGAIHLGGEVINSLIDQGAQLAQQAAAAAITAGTMGADAGAGGMAAGTAAQFGIGIAKQAAKRAVTYGFDILGIGADALLEQATPFGMPRWLTHDYSGFMPKIDLTPAATTTSEKEAQGTPHGTTSGAAPGPRMGEQNVSPAANAQLGAASSFIQQGLRAVSDTVQPPQQPPMFSVQNIYATDAADIGKQLTRQGQLAMMQYAGRP